MKTRLLLKPETTQYVTDWSLENDFIIFNPERTLPVPSVVVFESTGASSVAYNITGTTGSYYITGTTASRAPTSGVITNIVTNVAGATYSLFSDVQDLDLKENLQFPITYSIADIRTPQNRKSNFSKSIRLPGTDKNSIVLSHLYEIDIDSIFDVNKKYRATVLQDGLEIFNGSAKINNITRDDWNSVAYNISLDGELSNLFNSLKNPDGTDLMLSDLDISEYNHALTRSTILDSWTGTIQKGGTAYANFTETFLGNVADTEFAPGGRTMFHMGTGASWSALRVGDVVRFVMDNPGSTSIGFDASQGHHTVTAFGASSQPIINLSHQSGGFNTGELYLVESLGEGYVYPTISYGNIGTYANLDHNVRINWKPFIFAKTYLDKIFEYAKFTYESDFLTSQLFKRLTTSSFTQFGENILASLTAFTGTASIPISTFSFPYNVEISDVADQWDPINLWYTNSGNPNTVDFNVQFDIQNMSNLNLGYPVLSLVMYRSLNPDGSLNPGWAGGTGSNLADNGSAMDYLLIQGFFGTPGIGMSVAGASASFNRTFTLNLRPGEQVRIKRRQGNSPFNLGVQQTMQFVRGTLAINIVNSIPATDMTAKDYLISLINAFNLYIEPDRFNDRNLIIDPFDDYYNGGFIDWTNKVDISKTIEIEPLSTSTAKIYKFTYDDGGDYLNNDYKTDNQNVIYGSEEIIVSSEFVTNTVETKLKFSASPLADLSTSTATDPQTGSIIVPAFWKDEQKNFLNSVKPRLLYWTGLRYSSENFYVSIGESGGSGASANSTTNDYGMPMYGYAGHLDNPLDATLDLNFGLCEQYYYGANYPFRVTENTLYESYWSNYIEELSSKTSRLVSMYLKLSAADIAQLSFRRIYFIHGVYYRLQKIQDYNPLSSAPVLCEFIKADFTPSLEQTPSCLGVSIGAGSGPTFTLVQTTSGYLTYTIDGVTITLGSGDPDEQLGPIEVGPGSSICIEPSDASGSEDGSLILFIDVSASFTTIDLSQTPDLEYLDLIAPGLEIPLDLCECLNLELVSIQEYPFTSIDLTCLSQLTWFSCQLSAIETLDFSGNPNIFYIYASGCALTNVDDVINSIQYMSVPSGGTIDLSSGTSAARTSASDTVYNALVADGWTITTN